MENATITKEQIADVVKEVIAAERDTQTTPPPVVPAAEPKVEKMGERIPHWKTRLVRYFNALSHEGQGHREQAADEMATLVKQARSITDWQKAEEDKEAELVLSDLSKTQQERLMSTLTDGAGQYLLPKPFLAEVFYVVETNGVARQQFRAVPMIAKTLDLKTVATKPVVYWVDEGSNITASDLVFGAGQLVTKKLALITSWSTELTEDEAIAHLPIYTELAGEAIGLKEDLAGFIGDGTAGYGSFTGLLNSATAGYTMAAGKTAHTDLDADMLYSCISQLTLAKRSGAKFFMHPDMLAIIEQLKDLQFNYIYRKPADTSTPGSIWGYPIVVTEAMPATAGANTKFIVFGNPKWMLFGQRRGVTVDLSREAVLDSAGTISYNSFQADGSLLRITERVGFKAPLGTVFSYLKTAAA